MSINGTRYREAQADGLHPKLLPEVFGYFKEIESASFGEIMVWLSDISEDLEEIAEKVKKEKKHFKFSGEVQGSDILYTEVDMIVTGFEAHKSKNVIIFRFEKADLYTATKQT
jgi:hypothetical protein